MCSAMLQVRFTDDQYLFAFSVIEKLDMVTDDMKVHRIADA